MHLSTHPLGRAGTLLRGLERLEQLRAEIAHKIILELDGAEPDPDLEDDEREPGDNEPEETDQTYGEAVDQTRLRVA